MSRTLKILMTVLAVLLGLFAAAEFMIGRGVKKYAWAAQQNYPGDRVNALIETVECESCPMEDRNHAVWALGQLADSRALPVLEKYHTGRPCNHFSEICQHELQKALRLVRIGHNTEAFFWKWMLPDQS